MTVADDTIKWMAGLSTTMLIQTLMGAGRISYRSEDQQVLAQVIDAIRSSASESAGKTEGPSDEYRVLFADYQECKKWQAQAVTDLITAGRLLSDAQALINNQSELSQQISKFLNAAPQACPTTDEGTGSAVAGQALPAVAAPLSAQSAERVATSAENLRILRARLSAYLSPAEDRELVEAACALDQVVTDDMVERALEAAKGAMVDTRRHWTDGDRAAVAAMLSAALRFAPSSGGVAIPTDNDGKEQDAFEEWAKRNQYDMAQHPIHWLFLDSKTNAARLGWRGALEYAAKVVHSASSARNAAQHTEAAELVEENDEKLAGALDRSLEIRIVHQGGTVQKMKHADINRLVALLRSSAAPAAAETPVPPTRGGK